MRASRSTLTQTSKVRPWSKLPGVVAYMIFDPAGQLTDAWGDCSDAAVERAQTFRSKVMAGTFDGSHTLEPCGDHRLLSVSRPDGWFAHVWVCGETDIPGILSVVGG